MEVKALTPIRETVEKRAELPDLRDLFLCHAWADRLEDATELYDLLKARGVSVWFSEKTFLLDRRSFAKLIGGWQSHALELYW